MTPISSCRTPIWSGRRRGDLGEVTEPHALSTFTVVLVLRSGVLIPVRPLGRRATHEYGRVTMLLPRRRGSVLPDGALK